MCVNVKRGRFESGTAQRLEQARGMYMMATFTACFNHVTSEIAAVRTQDMVRGVGVK